MLFINQLSTGLDCSTQVDQYNQTISITNVHGCDVDIGREAIQKI